MAHSVSLKPLSPREAIADAMYRCVLGLDTNNRALFDSAFVPGKDAVFDMNGTTLEGKDAIDEKIFTIIGPLDTQHVISNVRIDYEDGADTAYMTAYAMAQHYRAGEGMNPAAKHLMSGSIYFVDLVKNKSDGLWKVKKWAMKIISLQGDGSIVGR